MMLAARQRLRLRLRDLAALSAFAAVALSGSLPVFVLGLFGLAFVLSLAGKRPFAGQTAWSVVVLLAAALVLFGLVFRGALDLVIAAVAFATLVTAHRMLAEPTQTTDQQVLLASLLLMAGAAALSGDIWYSLCLLLFGVFACLALGLAVIEGPVERDEELPLAPVLRQVSIGVAIALAGGVAFFILFPRLSWNMAARPQGPGLIGGTTGMTDRVRLGGGGDLKTSARIVLRARLEPMPSSERLEKYWVGRHFEAFDGKEWRGVGVEKPAKPRVALGENRGGIVQRIELLPAYDSRTLVGLAQPVYFGPANAITGSSTQPTALIESEYEEVRFASTATAYSYTVHSRDTPLRNETPERLATLVSTPDTLDPRVAQLAQQIVGNEKDPSRVAARLERWLQSNLAYSLELNEADDPLSDFLFVQRAGHCEHFATALAVMLRLRGVPARVVGGFFGGERLGERYVVRAGDAHAWVEAWVPDEGWVTFDATPDDGRGSRPAALMAKLIDGFERLEELWREKVVDYSIIDQWQFVRGLVRPPKNAKPDDDDPTVGAPQTRTPTRAIIAAVGAATLVWLVFRRLTRKTRPHPATSFLVDVERRVDALTLRRRGEDLEQLSRRLTEEHHRLASAVATATRRYLEARFGTKPLDAKERRLILETLR